MNGRVVAAVLLSLPPLYVTANVIGPLGQHSVAAPIALLVVVGLSLAAIDVRGWTYALLLAVALLVAITVAFAAAGPSDALPLGLVAGALLGLPWFAAAQTWRAGTPLGGRVVAFGTSTLLGLVYLATGQSLGGPGASWSPSDFTSALATSTIHEAQGIASLFVFGPTSPPVASFFDPIFATLTGLGTLALLLALVRPQTGEEVPLPIELWGPATAEADLAPVYGFSPEQLAVFRSRSRAEAPGDPWPPGLDSVVAAGLVTGLFLGAAIVTPYYAVAGLVLVLVAAVGVVLFVTERPAPFEPPTAASTPPDEEGPVATDQGGPGPTREEGRDGARKSDR